MSARFKELLYQGATIVIPAVATATWALVQEYWNWPTAIVYTLLMVCALWYLTDKLGIKVSAKTRIREWLDRSGFSIQTLYNENDFHYVVTDNVLLKVDIFRRPKEERVRVVIFGLGPTTTQRAVFDGWTQAQKDTFWKRVRIELLRMRASYSDLSIDGISIAEEIPLTTGLTEVEFFYRVRLIRGAARMYYEMLNSMLVPPPVAVSAQSPQPQHAPQISPPETN